MPLLCYTGKKAHMAPLEMRDRRNEFMDVESRRIWTETQRRVGMFGLDSKKRGDKGEISRASLRNCLGKSVEGRVIMIGHFSLRMGDTARDEVTDTYGSCQDVLSQRGAACILTPPPP